MTQITYIREDMFAFHTCSFFGNVSYKRPPRLILSVKELEEDADCKSSDCK